MPPGAPALLGAPTHRESNQRGGCQETASIPNSGAGVVARSTVRHIALGWAAWSGAWRIGTGAIRCASVLLPLPRPLVLFSKSAARRTRNMFGERAVHPGRDRQPEPPGSVLVGALSMTVQCTWRTQPSGTARADGLQHQRAGHRRGISRLWCSPYSRRHFPEIISLGLLALTYFCANTFPIAAIIGLTEGKRIFSRFGAIIAGRWPITRWAPPWRG